MEFNNYNVGIINNVSY